MMVNRMEQRIQYYREAGGPPPSNSDIALGYGVSVILVLLGDLVSEMPWALQHYATPFYIVLLTCYAAFGRRIAWFAFVLIAFIEAFDGYSLSRYGSITVTLAAVLLLRGPRSFPQPLRRMVSISRRMIRKVGSSSVIGWPAASRSINA